MLEKMRFKVDIDLLERAIERWGEEVQCMKIQEEALELSLAINQFQCPTKSKAEMLDKIYDELADNAIMVGYYSLLFDGSRIQRIIKQKLVRLENILDRLDEEDQEAQDEESYERSVSEDQF